MSLRKEIVAKFNEGEAKKYFKNLFQKELIKDDLQAWKNQYNPELFFDEGFKNFTTYFTGFHENRKNIYSAEEQSTAISYRIIHENLPKFIDNINLFNSIISNNVEIDFSPILTQMEELIQGESLENIFSLEFFNNVLSQNGIDFINFIIGGKSDENGNKIKGLNEYINLYNQKQADKRKRLPKFKQLYKQILSDRSNISFLPDAFSNDQELYDSINDYYKAILLNNEKDGNHLNILEEIKKTVFELTNFDISKIYLRRDTGFTAISQKLYGDYSVFKSAISHYYDTHIDVDFQTKISKPKLSEDALKKLFTVKEKWNKEYISIELLQTCLNGYINSLERENELHNIHNESIVATYFKKHFIHIDKEGKQSTYDFVSNINTQYKGIEGILNIEKEDKNTLKQDKDKIHQLKTFLDSILELQHFIKPLLSKDDSITEKDEKFYSEFNYLYEELALLTPLYNKVRNFVTQKPYETEKIKLNFENAQLLNGWDTNKEPDNTSILLRKDGLYYLAIMDKKHNKVFANAPKNESNIDSFEKMNYKLLPGANKMLPKVFFSASNIDFFNPSEEILKIRNTASHSKNGEPQSGFEKADFDINDCHKIIDFFKASLAKHKDWQTFGFQFSETHTYQDLSGFYREVENQGYKITFDNIPVEYIEEKVASGELYLFKIYNKDFSEHSKGTPNLHTLYWKMLFDENNLKSVVYKLNGQAEVFFRKAPIKNENIVVHAKNEGIKAKNPLKPNTNTFNYDIVKDRRYTIDKFQFHVPITMNFKANGADRINDKVNAFLQNNADVNIIGLDRGERHLIYLTLINQKGEILKQESLNVITNESHQIQTPYHTLLDFKEKQRADAREEWGSIESIKELKEGYISQVVHKIATMMVENNAIVVMEDLNFGFKRGRFHVEKQVYQKLEKMLIDKLNYLVFKNKDKNETGGVLNALQLSSKFDTFQKLGKQSGFIYYVPAWNTSKIDPITGFVDFLKPKYVNLNQAQEFFAKFKSIVFNKQKERFEFTFDYNNFTNKAEGSKAIWTICADNHSRYYFNRSLNQNKGAQQEVKVCQELELLFGENGITYGDGNDIKLQITAQNSSDFFKKLLKLLAVTTSLRHNNGLKGKDEQDFILSPVADENGVFFNSNNALSTQPKDADANGAYHIALKGLWVLQTLNKTTDLAKAKLSISNKEWLQFVQNKEFVN